VSSVRRPRRGRPRDEHVRLDRLGDLKLDRLLPARGHDDPTAGSERSLELDALDVAVPLGPAVDGGPQPPDRLRRGARLDAVLGPPHPCSSLVYGQMISAQTISSTLRMSNECRLVRVRIRRATTSELTYESKHERRTPYRRPRVKSQDDVPSRPRIRLACFRQADRRPGSVRRLVHARVRTPRHPLARGHRRQLPRQAGRV
jgi:hypothetical protein